MSTVIYHKVEVIFSLLAFSKPTPVPYNIYLFNGVKSRLIGIIQ